MPLRTLIGLILCNVVWSANPAMAKVIMADLGPIHTAWMRHFGATFGFLGAVVLLRRKSAYAVPANARDWMLTAALGFFSFCFTALLQMTGLSTSQAMDNALIIAMEPVITAIMAWIFLREPMNVANGAGFVVAVIGFSMLSAMTPGRLMGGLDPHMTGNLLILLALTGEALYSILGRKLTPRYPAVSIFGTAQALGFIFLTVATMAWSGLPAFRLLTLKSVLAILWLGPLGTTATYLYWMLVLDHAPIASLAITLFIQPLFGALWGHAFLGEHLSSIQALGGALILLSVLSQSMMRRI